MKPEKKSGKSRKFSIPAIPPMRLWHRIVLYLLTAVCVALSLIEVTFQCFPYAADMLFYMLAAVMLTVSCYYFIINIRRDIREIIKPAIAANRYTNMVAEDYRLRTILFAVPGMMSNIIFAVFNGVVAVTSRSAWLGTLAAYYILLSLMRSGVVTQEKRLSRIRDEKERMRKELRVYRRNSVMFLFLAVVLAGAAVLLVNSEGGKSYPGYAIYAVAAYTFYKIIMSTIQVLKVGKRKSPLLTITRRIGYIEACVSILTLQTAMFASFASGQEDFMLLMNAATGAVVCMMVLGLGIQGLCYYRKQTGGKA